MSLKSAGALNLKPGFRSGKKMICENTRTNAEMSPQSESFELLLTKQNQTRFQT